MKKRFLALLLSILEVLSLSSLLMGSLGAFAVEIDEDKIIGVEKLNSVDVLVGTDKQAVSALLPSVVTLQMAKENLRESTELHKASFNEGDWELFDANAITLDGEKLSIGSVSTKVKALTGGEYDDFVLETTICGTASSVTNNFGVMLRATSVTDASADSYEGYYVGIGKNDGKHALVIGYADGKWHLLDEVVIGYTPNKDYNLKIMMLGNTLAVWLDGELLYKKELTLYEKGRVGVRTYRQLFDVSSFTVRTPSAEDLLAAGIVEYDPITAEVGSWTSDNYDPDTVGKYTFKAKVKGTEYEVNCIVNVVKLLEINEELRNLSYEYVDITDGFFRDYMKQMICKVVPTAIKNVETGGGGMANIKNAAKKHRGEAYNGFSGMFYVDSDVHKVLESMCYVLSVDPMGDEDIISAQAEISAKLEEWIPYYVDAQEESGYFDTYYILNNYVKFSDVQMHELYCMGHFMEAAIAHYQYTEGSDTRLIEVAIKCADYLALTFGNEEGQLRQIGGHQEIEIALLKLAKTVLDMGGEYSVKAHKYANLAIFFLELRGDHENRTLEGTLAEEYWQDHEKVENQTKAVGHAVRAQYMYTAMTELASIDTEYRKKYDHALVSLWEDVKYTKQYVTGGVGQSASNEGFLDSYILPNASAYCETCAGISNMMWNRSMSKIYSGSIYADQIETDLYNAVLGCVNLDGDKFYYHNPLESMSGEMRNAWYGTACCPPNLTRTLLSLGGYIYNISHEALYVNQFISNNATVSFDGKTVGVSMTSDMPWEGTTAIKLSMDGDTKFKIIIRAPYWTDQITLKINGVKIENFNIVDSYITLDETWSDGDKISIEFSMPVIYEETGEKVTSNIGYTSLRRGPVVYCAEATDNDFNMNLAYIDKNATPKLVWTDSIDGKADPYNIRDMYTIKLAGYLDGMGSSTAVEWTFIPFYARLNRSAGHMTVYVAKEKLARSIEDYAKPSASYTYHGDSPYNLNDGSDDKNNRWTNWRDGTFLRNPWVQYDFDEEVVLSGCKIWWYDDNGGVRLPDTFEIYYKNNETDEFTKVEHDSKYLCTNADGFITYEFKDVAVTSLKIIISNSKAAAGIVEWKLIEGVLSGEPTPEPTPEPTTDPTTEPTTEPVVTVTPDPTVTPNPDKTDAITTPEPDKTDVDTPKKSSLLPVILGITAAVIAAAAITFVVIKRKKK